MLFLMTFGAIAVLHVREGWRRRRNRLSGTIVVVTLGVLVITAFGLYYLGSDVLRDIASNLHLVAGLILPLFMVVHVATGIPIRGAALGRKSRSAGLSLGLAFQEQRRYFRPSFGE